MARRPSPPRGPQSILSPVLSRRAAGEGITNGRHLATRQKENQEAGTGQSQSREVPGPAVAMRHRVRTPWLRCRRVAASSGSGETGLSASRSALVRTHRRPVVHCPQNSSLHRDPQASCPSPWVPGRLCPQAQPPLVLLGPQSCNASHAAGVQPSTQVTHLVCSSSCKTGWVSTPGPLCHVRLR